MTWWEQLVLKWPDFVISVVGSLIGVGGGYGVGWSVARWQQREERRQGKRQEALQLRALLQHLVEEIEQNQLVVSRMAYALKQSPHARVDLMRWVRSLAESLTSLAFEDLRLSGLHRRLRVDDQSSLAYAYSELRNLRSFAIQSEAAVTFFFGYRAAQDTADGYLSDLKEIVEGGSSEESGMLGTLEDLKHKFEGLSRMETK